MPEPSFFSRFGIYVDPGFLDKDMCARLRDEIRTSTREQATVHLGKDAYHVDPDIRKVDWARMPDESVAFIEERFDSLKPRLEEFFDLELETHEGLQFLLYREGCFYRPHYDRNRDPDGAEFSRARKISCVVFLNDQVEEPAEDEFRGGSLTFYGLMGSPDEDRPDIGFPVVSREGALVAFRSELLHGVEKVEEGERFSVVVWFR